MFESLLQTSYFALFLIISLGFILGRIKIKGLSLDVSAVIFIALLFGHFGVTIPKALGDIGLVLFIFTIGIQAGPGFFDSFRSKGKTLIILALLIVGSASITGIIFKYAMGIDTPSIVGLIAGALTSTPGLAVAIDTTQSSSASIAYGIAYPFGVIGVILFVKLLPKLLRQPGCHVPGKRLDTVWCRDGHHPRSDDRRPGVRILGIQNKYPRSARNHCRRNDQHTRTGSSRFDGRQLGSQHCLRYGLSHCHGLPDLVHPVHCRGYLKEQKE